jgi:hypothetical protein
MFSVKKPTIITISLLFLKSLKIWHFCSWQNCANFMAPTNTLDIYLFWFQLDIMKYTVITVDSHWKILIHKHLVYGISPQFIIAFSSNFTFLSCCSWCYSICGLFCFKFIYYDKNRRYFPSLYFSLFPEF